MGRGPRPVAPTLALIAGLAWAGAEILRQSLVPSPPGVPGDSGGSVLAIVALGLAVTAGPSLLVGLLPLRRTLVRETSALTAGLLLLASAASWRLADRAGALEIHPAWSIVAGFLIAVLVAVAAMGPGRRWPAPMRVPSPVAALVACAGLAFVLLSLRPAPAPGGGRGDQPNLLLVTIDTLRRDALGSYGGTSSTALDSLGATAHEGWSVSPWTQPAMASLFSSTIPTGHGSDAQHAPDPAVAWWPEHVAARGSRTAAFVTNPYLRRRFGFARGFGHFDHAEERPWLEPVARTVLAEWAQAWMNACPGSDRADTVIGRALNWLSTTSPDQPWFLWVHLLDPHLPYSLRGRAGAAARPDVPDWLGPLDGWMEGEGFEALHEIRDGSLVLDDAQRVALRKLYDTEVDYAAWWAARLVRRAREASGDRALVWVVTSDHGEEFFEEGGFEHGHSLADPVLRVPLLAEGLGEDPAALRLIDLGPLVLDALGADQGFEPARGTQLLDEDGMLRPYALPLAPRPAACDRPVMLAEGMLYGPARTRVFLPDGRAVERLDGSGEITILEGCADAIGIAAEFDWRALDLWRERRTLSPVSLDVDDDLRRQLRALGYVN